MFYEQREKFCFVSRKFQKKKSKKRFFYPSDLVNTKTTIPLRVGDERWIYIYLDALRLGKLYPQLFTSPSGNSFIFL